MITNSSLVHSLTPALTPTLTLNHLANKPQQDSYKYIHN